MNFICEPALREYMLKKKRSTILVEEITSSHSDFKSKKRYYTCKTDFGEVLLPPFKLKIQDTVTFSLKSFLGIKYVAQKGIVK